LPFGLAWTLFKSRLKIVTFASLSTILIELTTFCSPKSPQSLSDFALTNALGIPPRAFRSQQTLY